MNNVVLAFGSNLGDRERNIQKAVDGLQEKGIVEDIKLSPIINTKALLRPNSPKSWDRDFLNAVAVCRSGYGAHSLLSEIKKIEKKINSKVKKNWGPRDIDIDILLYGNKVISNKLLQVPHSELLNREFLLYLLSELKCEITYPVKGKFYGMGFKQLYKKLYG